MKIQLFLDKTGFIHGTDTGKITASADGFLTIGKDKIELKANEIKTVPNLMRGGSGICKTQFETLDGDIYSLNNVVVRGGRIAPPSAATLDIMELKLRADKAEIECREMREKIHELENIFDTNSLNFLIK